MSVYVFSTGSVEINVGSGFTASVTVNNRTTSTQNYRVITWNTSPGSAKTMITQASDTILANQTVIVPISVPGPAAIASFEIEIRLSSQHMAPFVAVAYSSPVIGAKFSDIYADELFRDFSASENP